MRDLAQAVSENIRRHRLFLRGDGILVAVSGGLDSTVLLHVLCRLSKDTGWRLTIAHLNHQLRGRSSNADERLVLRAGNALGLPVIAERADVRGLSRQKKWSLEMAARSVRHEFFARAAARLGLKVVALAHHADDQLELFFLRLLRGSGAQGLAGMKWKGPSPAAPGLELARPLLSFSKAELRQYAAQYKIRYREDASNACVDMLRNRVRHDLLPLLQRRYQPALPEVINRTVQILGAETELIEFLAGTWLRKLKRELARGRQRARRPIARRSPALPSFEQLPAALQRRVLQAQLLELGIVPDFESVEKLRRFRGVRISMSRPAEGVEVSTAASGPAKHVSVLRDAAGILHLGESLSATDKFTPGSLRCDLGRAGTADFGGARFRWTVEKGTLPRRLKPSTSHELYDADQVGDRIILRHWQPGDRFQPIGMRTSVKLQDFFTNEGVARARRRELILATTDRGEVFWVEGMRISERFKLTAETTRLLHWAWERL